MAISIKPQDRNRAGLTGVPLTPPLMDQPTLGVTSGNENVNTYGFNPLPPAQPVFPDTGYTDFWELRGGNYGGGSAYPTQTQNQVAPVAGVPPTPPPNTSTDATLDPNIQAILDLVKQSIDQTHADSDRIWPILLAQSGYKQNPDGTIRQMTQDERLGQMTPEQRSQYELNTLLLDREKKALEGTLPLPEGVQQELARQKSEQEGALSARLGTDWRMSTPGVQSQQKQNETRLNIEDAFRRGELTTGMGLMTNNQNMMQNWNAANNQALLGYGNRDMGLLQGYGYLMQPYENQLNRNTSIQGANLAGQYGLQAAQMNAAAQERSGLYGLLGTALGGAGAVAALL